MDQPTSILTLTRKTSTLLVTLLVIAMGAWTSTASAHTASATGECGSITFNWESFASSGATPANKPDWKVVKDSDPTPVASGQASFTGAASSLMVPIPSLNGSYAASSSWTAGNTRDGNAGSGQSVIEVTGCNDLSTTASPEVVLGGDIFDTAHLTGATDDASGTIQFKVFSDTDTQCENPLDTTEVPVSGNGDYPSAKYTPVAAGGYQWTASYSGDQNNDPLEAQGCDDPSEHVLVTKKTVPPVTPPVTPTPPPVVPPTPTTPTAPVTPAKPAKPVKPQGGVKDVCKVGGGRLRISGPSGNVRGPFTLRIKSRAYSRVSVYVDGKRARTFRHVANHKGAIQYRVNPRKMTRGVHRVKVVAGTGVKRCGTAKRRLRFVRASRAAAQPSFTG